MYCGSGDNKLAIVGVNISPFFAQLVNEILVFIYMNWSARIYFRVFSYVGVDQSNHNRTF